MSQRLPNYLRTYRKRACLTQKEVGFLLGTGDGSMVSRYERYLRQPTLETVLAYGILFGVPAWELVAGIHEKVEKKALKQARLLVQALETEEPNRVTARKLAMLKAICRSNPNSIKNYQNEE